MILFKNTLALVVKWAAVILQKSAVWCENVNKTICSNISVSGVVVQREKPAKANNVLCQRGFVNSVSGDYEGIPSEKISSEREDCRVRRLTVAHRIA